MIEFDWHLTNRCNFDCEYCHPQIKKVLNQHLAEPPVDDVVACFDRIGRQCLIHMSGGEPFLFPDFVYLCQALTRKHLIGINTNLSTPSVIDFANEIDTAKVRSVLAAIHAPERQRRGQALQDYAEKFAHVREKGFEITALYVLFPPLLDRVGSDIDVLTNLGVKPIVSKVFKGVYKHKRYPEGYDTVQQTIVRRYTGTYQFNEPYMAGQMCFRGQLCTAGYRSFKIAVTGDVQRCASVNQRYGNLYHGTFCPGTGPAPCQANRALVVSQCHRYLVCPPPNST